MDFEELKLLFTLKVYEAIEESKKMICSASGINSFEDFISHYETNAKFSICPNKYSQVPQLCVCCLDCTLNKDEPTTMCLSCFLNSNHKGHNFFIFRNKTDICSCGDKDFLKDTSFCSNHGSCNDEDNHPEIDLNENLRTLLTDVIFKAIFSSLKSYIDRRYSLVSVIFDFLMEFTKLGDCFIQLIVQTLLEKIDFDEFLMYTMEDYSIFNDCVYKLFYSIISNQNFRKSFTKSLYRLIFDNLGPESRNNGVFFSMVNLNREELIYKRLINICFSEPSCICSIEDQWNWVESCTKLLQNFKKLFNYDLSAAFKTSPPIFQILSKVQYMTKFQPNEETQLFFDRMVTEVFNINNENNKKTVIISTSKKWIPISKHYAFLSFIETLSTFLDCFKSKPNLEMEKLIQELDKIDITPIFLIGKNEFGYENDVLISKYLPPKNDGNNNSFFGKIKTMITNVFKSYPSKYYRSFCFGSSIFLSYPLYDVFGLLLRVDDLCRIKLAKHLCLENYRPLRIKLGIIALKKLLSFYCNCCGLSSTKNKALISFYDSIMSQNKTIKLNIIPVSILQIMIGLQSCDENEEFIIKEFFAYEIAREIGLFDKNFSDQIDYKFLVFIYVVLLIVIDRTVFYDDDCEKSMEEKIILVLKNKLNNIIDISSMVKNVFPNKPHIFYKMFNEILMKVATTKNNANINNDKNGNEEEEEVDENLMKSLLQSQVIPSNFDNDDDDDDVNGNDNNNENDNDNNNDNDNVQVNNGENENVEKEEHNIYGRNVKFYLKNGIKWKRISAVTSIYYQKVLLENEISKNPDKLLQLQEFEPEETFFFKSNDQISSEGLQIRLKELFITPTVFSVIYFILRNDNRLNLHLSMNILILISEMVKESEATSSSTTPPIQINEMIQCSSIIDLVSQLKKVVFHFRIEGTNEIKRGYINNTINPTNFNTLMNLKINFNQKGPKSFVDLLKEKGKIGIETLERISQNIPIDNFSNESKEQDEENEKLIKQMKKDKANKKKAEIMNHFQDQLNQYHFSDSLSASQSCEISPFNKEVCCICSESGKKEILCFPLYVYRTKLPFIFDKPPLFDKKTDAIAVDDNQIDFGQIEGIISLLSSTDSDTNEKTDQKSVKQIKTLQKIFQKEEYNEDSPKKRYTSGENYVYQFGIDPHPIHISCILDSVDKNGFYKCKIDNSIRNNYLPYLEEVPINKIFSNTETFTVNKKTEEGKHIIDCIMSFVDQFIEIFGVIQNTNKILELIKSISGLIVTYEIRLRNRPDSLDPQKNKILSRNLFLLAWYYFRIVKKPLITINGKNNENIFDESRLTDFQRFIKMLIECDDILDNEDKIQQIIPSIISSINDENVEIKEKKICLFLRRLCLAEYFLLNNDVNMDDKSLIDWDEILTAKNLSKRYKVKFTSIDVEKEEEFEFKPFSFMNFPKDFLEFSQEPFNYPIQDQSGFSFINFLDYNYLINHYDDLGENNTSNQNDEILHFKRIFADVKDDITSFECYLGAYTYRTCPFFLMFMQNISPLMLIIDRNYVGYLEPLYFDKFGCNQIHYDRHLPIYFNENRCEILIDKILSGDFSNDLFSTEDFSSHFRHA